MSAQPQISADEVSKSRAKLIEIRDRCAVDRYAFFPRASRELLSSGRQLRIVLFGTRGLGFQQQLDQIERVIALNPGIELAAIVDDETEGGKSPAKIRTYRTLSVEGFFEAAREFAGCLVVDRTCTWYPGIRYKVKLKQGGFPFLRMEQFLNAPGINAGAGYYREHADYMLAHFDELLPFESLWGDPLSVQTYHYALAAFITMNHEYFAFHCGDYRQRYFPGDVGLALGENTTYADCGSHDGQEALYFARLTGGRFRALHAFEPDRNNFRRLCENVNRTVAGMGLVPVYCHELGVYDRNAFLMASGYDAGVTILDQPAQGGMGIHVCRLDDMLDDLSHLRLEIEGAELAALHGARGLILKNRPSMAISVYHKATDFPDVIGFLREVDKGYRLSLRHQSLEPGVLCIYCT